MVVYEKACSSFLQSWAAEVCRNRLVQLGVAVQLVLCTSENNNNNNKRPLTPKSMPPAGDEHTKLKT